MQAALARRLSGGMQFLASIGSNGPFIGLFGTVYGIMNSFIGIANTNTTNLAVVAPGIAEALLATGLGLFAAIPAVIFYNYFQTRISAYGARYGRVRGRTDERDLAAARQGSLSQMAAKLSGGGGGRYQRRAEQPRSTSRPSWT